MHPLVFGRAAFVLLRFAVRLIVGQFFRLELQFKQKVYTVIVPQTAPRLLSRVARLAPPHPLWLVVTLRL